MGVAGDTKSRGLQGDPTVMMYTPYPQWTWPAMSLTIRTAGGRSSTTAISSTVWP